MGSSTGSGLVVIECKPKDEAEWRRRLERRGAHHGGGDGWHKPATWSDLERLLEGYGGCTEYDFGDVPRLVVDTTASVPVGDLVSSVVEFISSHTGGRWESCNIEKITCTPSMETRGQVPKFLIE